MYGKIDFEEKKKDRRQEWGYGEYDLDKPSRAVIAVRKRGETLVLHYVGRDAAMMIEEAGTGTDAAENIGLGSAEPGIFIWEGKYVWHPGPFDCPQDGDGLLEGDYREPTPDELAKIVKGECPWDAHEWDAPEEQRLEMEAKYGKQEKKSKFDLTPWTAGNKLDDDSETTDTEDDGDE